MYKALIITTLVNISFDQSMVTFNLTFDKDEFEGVFATSYNNLLQGEGEDQERKRSLMATALQTELRQQLEIKAWYLQLPIVPHSIYVLGAENIPISQSSLAPTTISPLTEPVRSTESRETTSQATKSTRATTTMTEASTTMETESATSTLATTKSPEICPEMLFLPCLYLTGFSHYYLPNWIGHSSENQATRAFIEMNSTSRTSAELSTECRSISDFFLCVLLFPPCMKSLSEEGKHTPVYPCASLCNAVESACGSSLNWSYPCETFPTRNCTAAPPTPTQTTTTKTTSTSTVSVPSTTATEKTTEEAKTETVTEPPDTTTLKTTVKREQPLNT
ncbi:hypothetical protein EGW08_002825, partial [Elysia chlorotica]